MPLDRTWYNSLVDGPPATGTLWNKAAVDSLMDAVDAALAVIVPDAGQIAFPATQNPSAGANTLDDYEEGTWTVVIGGAGGTSGQTYSSRAGSYVKIGRVVVVTGFASLTAKGTITGNVQIQGLPFASVTTTYAVGTVQWNLLATTWASVVGVIAPNSTAVALMGATVAAVNNGTALVTADIGNTTEVFFTFTYITAA